MNTVFDILLSNGADLGIFNNADQSVLEMAISHGNYEMGKRIVLQQPDTVTKVNRMNQNILHSVSQSMISQEGRSLVQEVIQAVQRTGQAEMLTSMVDHQGFTCLLRLA